MPSLLLKASYPQNPRWIPAGLNMWPWHDTNTSKILVARVFTLPVQRSTGQRCWPPFSLGYTNLISSQASSQLCRREAGTACTCSLPPGNRLSLSLLLWAGGSVSRTWLRNSSWGCAHKLHPAKQAVYAPGTAQVQPGRKALHLPTIFRKQFKQWETVVREAADD